MDAVTTTPAELPRVLVRTAQHEDRSIAVAFSDRGHGIARQKMAQLFQSFYTTKTHGLGLGFSKARTILESHGGRIWAEAGLDEGATFRFCLPGAPAAKPRAEPEQREKSRRRERPGLNS